MAVPNFHPLLSDFDPCNAVIAPIDFRNGREILFADRSRGWLPRDVETGPAAEPLQRRDRNLKPRGLDAARVGPDDSAWPHAEFSSAQTRNGREPMRTKYEAQRAVLVLFAKVVAFLVAGAGAAAWNTRGAIAETRRVVRTHEVLTRIERTLWLNDQIRSVAASIRAAGEGVLARFAVHAETTTWLTILPTASLATANCLLVVFSYHLIMRRQDLAGRWENLAMTDPLTGLANRRALETALESAVSRAKRYSSNLSVIFLDVDHFKQFNDRFGHEIGDKVLRAVARVLLSAVRAEDVAGRYGGEEFLVVLPEADEAGSVKTAERIRTAVRALDLPLPPVTISLGVATLGAQSASVAALVAEADQALYMSKQSGRDRVTYFPREPRIPGECVVDGLEDRYLASAVGAPSRSEVKE